MQNLPKLYAKFTRIVNENLIKITQHFTQILPKFYEKCIQILDKF